MHRLLWSLAYDVDTVLPAQNPRLCQAWRRAAMRKTAVWRLTDTWVGQRGCVYGDDAQAARMPGVRTRRKQGCQQRRWPTAGIPPYASAEHPLAPTLAKSFNAEDRRLAFHGPGKRGHCVYGDDACGCAGPPSPAVLPPRYRVGAGCSIPASSIFRARTAGTLLCLLAISNKHHLKWDGRSPAVREGPDVSKTVGLYGAFVRPSSDGRRRRTCRCASSPSRLRAVNEPVSPRPLIDDETLAPASAFRLVKKDTPRRAYPSYELQSRDDRGIAVAPLLRRVCGLRVGLRTSDARPSRVGATRLASSPPWLPVYSLLVRCLRAFPLHTWPAASPGSRRRRRRLLCTVALDDCPFAHHWPSTLWAGRLRTIRPVSVVPLLHGPSRYWSRVPVSKLRRPQLSSATFRVRLASIHVTAVEGLTSRPRPTTSTVTRPKLSASLVHTLDVVALVESTSTSTSLCSTTSRMLSAGSAAWPGGKRLGAALAQGRQRPTIRGWLASSGLRGGEVMAALLRGLFRQPYAARHAFLSSRGASPPQAGSSETEVSRNSVIHVCTAASQHLPPSLMASLPLPLLLPTPSYTSLSSHWSDSTPLGATISLHTLAKPLMRLQYHREVQQLITRHHGAVLIEESMEVLVTYLRYKYVGPVTKKLILEELSLRAAIGDAQIITDVLFSLPDLLSELLSTSAGRYRKNLGTQKLPDDFLCEVTLELLGKLARSLSGSSAIISSGVLCHVPALLNSSSTVWQLTCQLLASLHSHFCHRHGSDSTDARIPSEALLALVHAAEYGPLNQCHLAWSALVPIARWECSALAMVNAGVWNVAAHSLHWFEPSSGEIYLQKHFPPSDLELKVANYACRVISGLLEHHSAIPSGTLDFIPPAHLGFWITQPGMQVSADAVFNHYSFEEMTPKAILGNYFECLSILLSSRVDSAPEKLQYICGVLGALTASHKSIAAALLQLPADPIRFLIWCLSHPHVQKQAITTLTTFASYPEGHQHTVKIFTKMEAVAILVASEDHAIQNWVLAMHEEAMPEKKKKKKKTTDSRYLQIPAWITAQ
uniref:Uncharacterized protein n=1 Tax=Mycena chlorophos TaxID=658473 RepID=A0ABQ0L361_MYCCL|nr:predicted protein [Mycena chlorophos]